MTDNTKPRIGPLKDVAGVRRELARVYRAARQGDISPQDGSRLAFILREIRESVAGSDFERRIDALEAALAAAEAEGRRPARRRAA